MDILFLDTEFTNIADPSLISIGLVSASGRQFYAEMGSGWEMADCSLFTLG